MSNEEQMADTIEMLYQRLNSYNRQDLFNYGYLLESNQILCKDIEEKDKQLGKYKNVIDKIKKYCKDKIQEQKEMIDFSKYYLENYDKAISETNSSHSGIILETIKSTTIKRYEAILELMEEVE